MFPRWRQRLLITGTLMGGAGLWLMALPLLKAENGSSGLSLVERDHTPLWMRLGLTILLGLPVGLLAAVTSASGNPMSGLFAAAAALWVLAGTGGSIDGWFDRQAEHSALPGCYRGLIAEVLIWQVGLLVLVLAIQRLRSPMRARFPALAYSDHLGVDTHIRLPRLQAILAGLTSAVVAAVIVQVIIPTDYTGQVLVGLFCAFAVGGLVGQLVFPQSNPAGILFSPALVACGCYAWAIWHYPNTHEFLAAHYGNRLAGGTMALPIHYFSAGVAGSTLGIGWAQGLTVAPQQSPPDAAPSEPGTP